MHVCTDTYEHKSNRIGTYMYIHVYADKHIKNWISAQLISRQFPIMFQEVFSYGVLIDCISMLSY